MRILCLVKFLCKAEVQRTPWELVGHNRCGSRKGCCHRQRDNMAVAPRGASAGA